jgi:hypothetical protein
MIFFLLFLKKLLKVLISSGKSGDLTILKSFWIYLFFFNDRMYDTKVFLFSDRKFLEILNTRLQTVVQ